MIDTAHAASLLGGEVVSSAALSGGDLSEVVRLSLASGTTVIAKRTVAAVAEADMLIALATAGAPVPEVLAASDDLLILEDLGADSGIGRAWGDLGRALAQLHGTTGSEYGWKQDHAFGSVTIPNSPAPYWPEFWVQGRLRPSLGHLPANLARRVERLCERLGDRLPADPPAALLHGDLWTGNVIGAGERVSGLIDPACYYGHAEVDLAMLTLFGAPTSAFWREYGETEPGLKERRPVYQLWPALVHVRLFGGSYLGLVERLLVEVDRPGIASA